MLNSKEGPVEYHTALKAQINYQNFYSSEDKPKLGPVSGGTLNYILQIKQAELTRNLSTMLKLKSDPYKQIWDFGYISSSDEEDEDDESSSDSDSDSASEHTVNKKKQKKEKVV